MRSLSPEEKALWERVAATIRPLSREPLNRSRNTTSTEPKELKRGPQRGAPPRPPVHASSARPASLSGGLDSSWDRRLRCGEVEPDRVLDLHGKTLDQAWVAIDRALEAAIHSGDRLLLLITGHARPGNPPLERGRIRAAVHDWLAASPHSSRIAAVRGAHRRHGGGGSLYIILRRNRSGSTFS